MTLPGGLLGGRRGGGRKDGTPFHGLARPYIMQGVNPGNQTAKRASGGESLVKQGLQTSNPAIEEERTRRPRFQCVRSPVRDWPAFVRPVD